MSGVACLDTSHKIRIPHTYHSVMGQYSSDLLHDALDQALKRTRLSLTYSRLNEPLHSEKPFQALFNEPGPCRSIKVPPQTRVLQYREWHPLESISRSQKGGDSVPIISLIPGLGVYECTAVKNSTALRYLSALMWNDTSRGSASRCCRAPTIALMTADPKPNTCVEEDIYGCPS